MYAKSAEFYDALYAFKDYAAETKRLIEIIQAFNPGAKSLLDIACGTGKHLSLLSSSYLCEGVDIEPDFVRIAAGRCSGVPVHQRDFTELDLGKRFDVATCLFSAIGYANGRLNQTIQCMANHLMPGGVLIVEPWFFPEQFHPGGPHRLFVDLPELKIARMNMSEVDGTLSSMEMHHLVGTQFGVDHFIERHEMTLWTKDEYVAAFKAAGLKVSYDEHGLMGRGLFIGCA